MFYTLTKTTQTVVCVVFVSPKVFEETIKFQLEAIHSHVQEDAASGESWAHGESYRYYKNQ